MMDDEMELTIEQIEEIRADTNNVGDTWVQVTISIGGEFDDPSEIVSESVIETALRDYFRTLARKGQASEAPSDTKELDARGLKAAVREAYAAGFARSIEGYNAEYPFDGDFEQDSGWLLEPLPSRAFEAGFDAARAYLSHSGEGVACRWTDEQIGRFSEALCAEDVGDPLRASAPRLEALARHVLNYVFRSALTPDTRLERAVDALRLHVAYEAVESDRGGKDGPKGRAWQAFIDARDAILSSIRSAS